jgi:hypothetical protein
MNIRVADRLAAKSAYEGTKTALRQIMNRLHALAARIKVYDRLLRLHLLI